MSLGHSHHLPVLCEQAVEALVTDKNGTYVDATFGAGGHSVAILSQLNAKARLLALDRDATAVERGCVMSRSDRRLEAEQGCFSEMGKWLKPDSVHGVLMDLGISSDQLEDAKRGFSFQHDGPLDMRVDRSSGLSLNEWLEQVQPGDLEHALRAYGDERFARRIANHLCQLRDRKNLPKTTQELAQAVASCKPTRDGRIHPATRSFLAFRVAVNQEVRRLQAGLEAARQVLKIGGRLVVISFQSLEDRIVKTFFRPPLTETEPRHLTLPPSMVKAEAAALWNLVEKAMKPSRSEIQANPRARSAILRAAEKTR